METFNIKFVGVVEKYPVLYDYTLLEYSRKTPTEEAWKKVAEEVNLSVNEAKEKWRNLRTTFVKNIKPKPSRIAKRRRPYYLMEAMQFTLPFVKGGGIPTANLSKMTQMPHTSPSATPNADGSGGDVEEEDYYTREITIIDPHSMSPSTAYIPMPVPSPPLEMHGSRGATTNTSRGPHGLPVRKRNTAQSKAAEKTFAAYLSPKPAKLCIPTASVSPQGKKEEGVKHFVMSLIPDLMKFDDVQLRSFKRQVLTLIDDVAETTSNTKPHVSLANQSDPSTLTTTVGREEECQVQDLLDDATPLYYQT